MISKELRMAACEINQILRYTDDNDVRKIPLKIRSFLKDIADEHYIPDINPEISLDDHKLLPETEEILAMFYYYYWADEKEKDALPESVKEKAKLADEILIFQELRDENEKILNSNLTIRNENLPWYKRIFNFSK